MQEIGRQGLACRNLRPGMQPDHQIIGRQIGTAQTKLLTNDAFDPITVNRPFEQFFADNQTEPGRVESSGTRLKMQHQPLPANRPPETKNG